MDRAWNRLSNVLLNFHFNNNNNKQQRNKITNNNSIWANLPIEILVHIFTWLDNINDIHSCSLVCSQWFYCMWNYQTNMNLSTIRNSNKADLIIDTLSNNCPRLQKLELYAGTDNGFKNLKNLQQIECLRLERCFDITDISLNYISSQNYLKDLTIARCNITDKGIKYIQNLPLKRLNLFGLKQITDESISTLDKLTLLEVLSLHGCTKITDKGLQSFKNSNKLQKIDLSWCVNITGEIFKDYYNLTNLQSVITRWDYCINDNALFYLGNILSLTELNLAGCEQITINGIKSLHNLSNLKHLNLGEVNKINDEGIHEILNSLYSKTLESLVLRYLIQITDKSFKLFPESLLSLKLLNIQACVQVTNDCLYYISQMQSLQELNLSANYITDKGINDMIQLETLETLVINQCPRITDRSLERLALYPSLKNLSIQGCKRISNSALEYFCEIVSPSSLSPVLKVNF